MAGLKELVQEARAGAAEVSPGDARTQIEAGALVVDVREPAEFMEEHIDGAVNVPRGLLELRAAADSPVSDARLTDRRTAPIVVYCTKSPSARSFLAAQTLARLGYEDVAVLGGGLDAWSAANLPTARP